MTIKFIILLTKSLYFNIFSASTLTSSAGTHDPLRTDLLLYGLPPDDRGSESFW